jgi:hypothetical protein
MSYLRCVSVVRAGIEQQHTVCRVDLCAATLGVCAVVWPLGSHVDRVLRGVGGDTHDAHGLLDRVDNVGRHGGESTSTRREVV